MNSISTISDLETYLSSTLDFNRFTAIDTINGVQVSRNDAPISKIAYAVDSSLSIIENAATQGADVLLVHHGFYWGKVLPLIDTMYQKSKALLDANMALVACHLPLDAHMEFGNNAQLAKRLGLQEVQPFGDYKEVSIGVQGSYSAAKSLNDILEILFRDDNYGGTTIPIVNTLLDSGVTTDGSIRASNKPAIHKPLGLCKSNCTNIHKVAIISGGGTNEIDSAYLAGADLYITGDASHVAWLRAKELGINLIFAGHYFTEVWGVLALAEHLLRIFDIKGVFIDEATRL